MVLSLDLLFRRTLAVAALRWRSLSEHRQVITSAQPLSMGGPTVLGLAGRRQAGPPEGRPPSAHGAGGRELIESAGCQEWKYLRDECRAVVEGAATELRRRDDRPAPPGPSPRHSTAELRPERVFSDAAD